MPYDWPLHGGMLDWVGLAEEVVENIAINDGAVILVEVSLELSVPLIINFEASRNSLDSLFAIVRQCYISS